MRADPWPVETLEAREKAVAEEIRVVLYDAYLVEAGILGVEDFVPLRRTANQIASAEACFFGIRRASELAAVAELEDPEPLHAHIGSLAVSPRCFRQGMGTALLGHIIRIRGEGTLTVSTARRNRPALELYERNGFKPAREWETPDGISMLTLARIPIEHSGRAFAST